MLLEAIGLRLGNPPDRRLPEAMAVKFARLDEWCIRRHLGNTARNDTGDTSACA
jgi:hypothetical protein